MAQSQSSTASTASPLPRVVAAGGALLAVLVAVKVTLLPFPVSNFTELCRWCLRLGVVSSPDMAFVALLTLAWLMVGYCVNSARGQWLWRMSLHGVFVLAAVYGVAAIPMYAIMKGPFSARLLSFAGGPMLMASSIGPFVSVGVVAALIAAPLLVMACIVCGARYWPNWLTSPRGRRVLLAALLVAVLQSLLCETYIARAWTDPNRWERRIARSPHAVLLGSLAEMAFSSPSAAMAASFTQVNVSDFVDAAADAKSAADLTADAPVLVGARPKNVLFIALESIGTEYVSSYGSKHDTTPNLDRLARERGVLYENIYAQATSSCKSLLCLASSIYPRPDWLLIVRDYPKFDVPMIQQVLKGHGYRTCYAHSGYWGWKGRDRFLQNRGIDHAIDASGRSDAQVNSWGIRDQTMYEELLAWIDQDRSQPFFAYAYTIETHHPYVAPAEMRDFGVDDPELNRYLNAVRAADAKLGWLMNELERRELADDTLVVITADHGESFGQHGQRVHSFGVYEPDVHVPLILLHPSLARQPRRQAAVGQHIDIVPTILDMLDVPAPAAWQGHSLLRGNHPPRAYFLAVGNEVILGLREGNLKYHYYVDSHREELFDLTNDPGELVNLAASQPAACESFRQRVGGLVKSQREFLARHGAP